MQNLTDKDIAQFQQNVLGKSGTSDYRTAVQGYDFNEVLDYDKLFDKYITTGFQSTNLGKAEGIINKMLSWRLSQETIQENEDDDYKVQSIREQTKCTIYLGYTSNLVSSGLREVIRYLCEHKLVDVIVTTAGGVEEDFIKCLAPTYIGEFDLDDKKLRQSFINRIGNLIVPNDNYCAFEDWIIPIFEEMHQEQIQKGTIFSPSKIIKRLGQKINNKDSIYYWCAKNDIPVFCPAITDGSIGDMLFFFSYKHDDFIVDLIQDIKAMNRTALRAKKSGLVILGSGIVKHHILNANMLRNGADFAVYINTAAEFDGSDAGARPNEALSWGKLKLNSEFVKIFAEATLVFPILVARTFYKYHSQNQIKLLETTTKKEKEKDNQDNNQKQQ